MIKRIMKYQSKRPKFDVDDILKLVVCKILNGTPWFHPTALELRYRKKGAILRTLMRAFELENLK